MNTNGFNFSSSNNSLFGHNKFDIRTINKMNSSDYNTLGVMLSHNALMKLLGRKTNFEHLYNEFVEATNSIKDQITNIDVHYIMLRTKFVLNYFCSWDGSNYINDLFNLTKAIAHDITKMSSIMIDNNLMTNDSYNNHIDSLRRNEPYELLNNIDTYSDHVLTYAEYWDQLEDEDYDLIKSSKSCCSMNVFCNEYCGALYSHNEAFGVGGVIMCQYEQQLYYAVANKYGTVEEDDSTGEVKFIPSERLIISPEAYKRDKWLAELSDTIDYITTAVELTNLNCVIETVFDFVIYDNEYITEFGDVVAECDDEYYD